MSVSLQFLREPFVFLQWHFPSNMMEETSENTGKYVKDFLCQNKLIFSQHYRSFSTFLRSES